jgi:hypothetical protein
MTGVMKCLVVVHARTPSHCYLFHREKTGENIESKRKGYDKS